MVRWFCLSVCMSVILSVRYRNHFPVVQFQNQAHIWNPRGTGHVFKTIWGAAGAPWKRRPRGPKFVVVFFAAEGGVSWRPDWGAPGAPNKGCSWRPNFISFVFTAAEGGSFPNRRQKRPNGVATGAQRWCRGCHSPGGRGKSRLWLEFREFISNFDSLLISIVTECSQMFMECSWNVHGKFMECS